MDGLFSSLLEKEGLRLNDDLEEEMNKHQRRLELWDCILTVHFELIQEGNRKNLSAETHYREIAEKVAFDTVDVTANIRKDIKAHEES